MTSRVNKRRKILFYDDDLWLSPTLGHLATVKIIGTLLKDPEYKEAMKMASWNIRSLVEAEDESEQQLKYLIGHIGMRVNTLPVSKSLKTYLNRFHLFMTIDTIIWLVCVADTTPVRLSDQYWSKTIYELISHLQWDDLGCVDGPKTLKSYVSNRKTVDFLIWNQLCLHYMKDEIIEFSKTIEWKECSKVFTSPAPVYWYRKIYGCFPNRKMYQTGMEREIFWGKINETFMLRNMFQFRCSEIMPEAIMTVSGIKYCRNHLINNRKLVEWASEKDYERVTNDVILYLMRTKGSALWDKFNGSEFEYGPMHLLFQPPLILLIDDWIRIFDTSDPCWFLYLFDSIGKFPQGIKFDCNIMLYEPFEKAWRAYCKIFSFDREEMAKAFIIIFNREDMIMRKLMFKGLEDHERIVLLKSVKKYAECEQKRHVLYDIYTLEFSEQVLQNVEERELFSTIPKLHP